LDFQLIKEEPRKTQKPVVDRLVYGQLAQSESQKPLSWRSEFAGKKSPCPGVPLM